MASGTLESANPSIGRSPPPLEGGGKSLAWSAATCILLPKSDHLLPDLSSSMDDLRYPIGRFRYDPSAGEEALGAAIDRIAEVPARLREAVQGLSDAQLDTRYRPGGWTVRQVVHHVADSHINAYVRLRLALTEETPTVRPYQEGRWAELEDARTAPVGVSLRLLEALHERWVRLLRALPSDAMQRPLHHPGHGQLTVSFLVQMYAWHGQHHVAHVTRLREREGW